MRLAYKILLVAIILGVAFDVLFYKQPGMGVNLLIAEILFIAASVGLAKESKQIVPTAAYVSGSFALAFSATFAIWTSEIGLAVSFFGFLFANILFAVFILGESAAFRHPLDVLSHMTLLPARHALRALPLVRHLKPQRLSDKTVAIIKAVVIALPILLIFTALLASADAVFGDYVQSIIDWVNSWADIENIIGHAWYIGFFAVLFGLYMAAAFLERSPGKAISDALPRGILESKVILGLVITLFAAFLLVQGGMLFGGETTLRALDLTYSEYARQGFSQLCVVAILVLGLVLTLRVLHGEKVDRKLLWLHAILLVETALMVASATMRLELYTDVYGFTPARLFGSWAIGVVGILLILTFFNVIFQRNQRELMRGGLIFVGLAMLLFTISAPDARAARLNIDRITNDHLLSEDILDLSEEAYDNIRAAIATKTFEDMLTYSPSADEFCAGMDDGFYNELDRDYHVRLRLLHWLEQRQYASSTPVTWQLWNASRAHNVLPNDAEAEIPTWLQSAADARHSCDR